MKHGGSKPLPARKQRRENKLTPYLFLLPTVLLMGTFVYFPFVKTIGTSFFLTNATDRQSSLSGWKTIKRSSVTAFFSNPSKTPFSMH